jgi:hypothetical protein
VISYDRYSLAVYQVMVTTVKLSKGWLNFSTTNSWFIYFFVIKELCILLSISVPMNVISETYRTHLIIYLRFYYYHWGDIYVGWTVSCKGLTFLFICVVVKLFFIKFINITRVVESSFKRVYKVNYYNYMVCNVRRICNVYIVNIKVRIKTYLCPKFVIMCKYENCVCKYLTFLFRSEILFENNLIILLYDNVQQYN